MIKCIVYLKDIDDMSLVELMMPYLEKWLSEKDNRFFDMMNDMVSSQGRPTRLSKFIVSSIPNKLHMTAYKIQINKNGIRLSYRDYRKKRVHQRSWDGCFSI